MRFAVAVGVPGSCVGGGADLADDLVEMPERFGDALPGCLGGQVGRGLQAEPDVEQGGDDRVKQVPPAVMLLGRGPAGAARSSSCRVPVTSRITARVNWPAAVRTGLRLICARKVVPSLRSPTSRA